METQLRHYPDWKAPAEDGSILIWPKPAELLRDAQSNHQLLGDAESLLQNVPLREVRKRMREYIGHKNDQPLVATGHQTELHHPGVWVKNILIDQLAERLQGQAHHFAIDTDSPKHLSLRWPGDAMPLTDDPTITSASWTAQLDPPTPAYLEEIGNRFLAAARGWNFESLVPDVLHSLRRLSLESSTLSAMLANAMHELDWSLGLRHHVLLSSPIWNCEPHLIFAHDLIAKADIVANRYNAALQAYRDEQGITSHMRPMPDLFFSGEAVEIPFWLDDLTSGKRSRPSVFRTDRGWMLQLINGEEFVFDVDLEGWQAATNLQKFLNQTNHRITPRALTNMLFLRLLLADQFIHGIGGGRYDQVTDRFIASQYRISPPAFGVTTATMYFPAAVGQQRVCIPCVKQEGHRLKHELLGSRKRELVAEIATLPRRSAERTTRFFDMHGQLASAAANSDILQRWRDRMRETQEREKQEQTLFDRELFYAIQPRDRLAGMIQRYSREMSTTD